MASIINELCVLYEVRALEKKTFILQLTHVVFTARDGLRLKKALSV
jgi:hypothetical protein